MGTRPLHPDDAFDAVRQVAIVLQDPGYYWLERRVGQKSARSEAARRMGIDDATLARRLRVAKDRYGACPSTFPVDKPVARSEDDEIPDGREVLDRHKNVNAAYISDVVARQRAKMFLVPKEPFAVAFVGDPHLDNKGCDLAALEKDLAAIAATGIRAVNMGDLLDNFHHRGKLAAKQAQNRMSEKEGLALSRWFLRDCGVRWDAHLLGNHDEWPGTAHGALMQEWAGRTKVFHWMGRLIYNWGDGAASMLAAHDFKGNSQYNPLHALAKRALEDGQDDAYVAAHRHTAAQGSWESGFRQRHYVFARARGYKKVDEFAYAKGFPEQSEGATVVLVVDPFAATKAARITTHMSVPEGVEHLNYVKNLRTA